VLVATLLAVPVCSPPASEATSTTDTDTDTDTDSGTDTAEDPTDGGEAGNACVPGKVESCPCTGGGQGVQTCNLEGDAFGPCDCPDPTGVSGDAESSGESSSPTNATVTNPGETTDEPPDLTTSTTDDTTTDATTTGPDDTTTTGDPPGCEDPDDAPDDEMDALAVGEINCQAEPQEFPGLLAGASDVDWFFYHGVDMECGFDDNPQLTHTVDASDNLRLCVFADCDMGTPQFMCQNGAQQNVSPEGLAGCCNDGEVTYTLNCMGTGNESANVYVRLDMADGDACVDYTVTYSYEGGF
jgi:hypothetical protein